MAPAVVPSAPSQLPTVNQRLDEAPTEDELFPKDMKAASPMPLPEDLPIPRVMTRAEKDAAMDDAWNELTGRGLSRGVHHAWRRGGATVSERGLATKIREEYEIDPKLPKYENEANNQLRMVANTVIHHRSSRPIGMGVEELFTDVIGDPSKYGLKEYTGREWIPSKYPHLKDLGMDRIVESMAPDSKLSEQRKDAPPPPAPAPQPDDTIQRYEKRTREKIESANLTDERKAEAIQRMQIRIQELIDQENKTPKP